jgi:hypothetical protein
MIHEMRKRFFALGIALGLIVSIFSAAPASAAYGVTITFPGGDTEFYSPFGGPATIHFSFDPGDPPTLFRVRLRPVGGTAIKTSFFSINPASQTSPVDKQFSWDALSTGSDKPYEVLVNPDGSGPTWTAPFVLKPRLVSITSIKPNPFLPWVQDGYRDTTDVTYRLAATSQPTEAHVYNAKLNGSCCASEVRFENLGTKVPGSAPEVWTWDGKNDSNSLLPKGDYFVKIRAEDPANVVRWSKPAKVSIARTYLKLSTVEKNGIAYHHTGPVTSYRRGGNCFVTQDETDKDLWITCLSASFTVYWRWAVPAGSKLQKASFVFIKVSSSICNAKKGITRTDSYLKVGGVGQFRCRIDKARATYGVPTAS